MANIQWMMRVSIRGVQVLDFQETVELASGETLTLRCNCQSKKFKEKTRKMGVLLLTLEIRKARSSFPITSSAMDSGSSTTASVPLFLLQSIVKGRLGRVTKVAAPSLLV